MKVRAKKLLEFARRTKLRLDPRLESFLLPQWNVAEQTRYRIGIIGGGIAGLTTVWLLNKLGHDVMVFEAKDRLGGRIYTLNMPPDHRIRAEVGAARIADTHQLSLYWIRRFSLCLKPMYPSSGRLVRLDKHGRHVGRDVAGLSTHCVRHLISGSLDWSSQFFNTIKSARSLFSESLIYPSWYRISGGNECLPNAMATDLGDKLRLKTCVLGVEQTDTQVRVSYESNGDPGSSAFDRVVLFVPLSTQRSIIFLPPLPDIKHTTATTARQQSSIRLFFQLRDKSWMKGGVCGFGSTEEGYEIWHPTLSSSSNRSLLILYAQGQAAERFIKLDQKVRIRHALSVLDQMFPGTEALCEDASSYCWDEDPWAGGAQTLLNRQGNARWDAIIKPEGQIHFAGEYTTGGGQ